MSDPSRTKVTREDVLDVFRSRADPAEPLTAPEVADRLDCSRRTALDRLQEIADSGEVADKKVGGRSRVWWLPIDRGESAEGITAADPFWSTEPYSGGEPVDEEEIDDIVYGGAGG